MYDTATDAKEKEGTSAHSFQKESIYLQRPHLSRPVLKIQKLPRPCLFSCWLHGFLIATYTFLWEFPAFSWPSSKVGKTSPKQWTGKGLLTHLLKSDYCFVYKIRMLDQANRYIPVWVMALSMAKAMGTLLLVLWELLFFSWMSACLGRIQESTMRWDLLKVAFFMWWVSWRPMIYLKDSISTVLIYCCYIKHVKSIAFFF